MQTKIGLISLGCAKNLVDSEHMLARLREAGYTIVDALETAEVVIINTCGFIEAAKEEAIAAILETAQLRQTGMLRGLIVTGCRKWTQSWGQAVMMKLSLRSVKCWPAGKRHILPILPPRRSKGRGSG